ncbi:galactose mutarotase [Companilactobacillus allii]|uniref:Galactose mutarotase n=1 Tax=Companilactobacillus allii TaxID=1847728 RepID=A0A1P8Q4N7_9LACO|nr:aldose epimerase family protein [Companilactobacillus allii]APX72759.1 galactose mutarotase [Companilactobacillus allii]USQ67546.1 galactose mutarotase [Companilactobacillus allii]
MSVTEKKVGQVDGENAYQYIIENKNKTRITLLTYAATWQNFEVLENGQYHSLIEHLDTLDDYVKETYNIGKNVGRVAGRIGGASFMLNGKKVQMKPNEQTHLLHGGNNGIQTKNYKGAIDDKSNSVCLSLDIKSSDDDFPGNVNLKITYSLNDNDEVTIKYDAISDADTILNPTCHVYFNVTNSNSIDSQELQINSDRILDVDDEKVPTGRKLDVSGAYDFREPQGIGEALKTLTNQNGKVEFDDIYATNGGKVATIQADGRAVDLYSDRNALVIFTADPVHEDKEQQHEYSSLAMELQTLPDAINHSDFGDIILRENQEKTFVNKYHYRKL